MYIPRMFDFDSLVPTIALIAWTSPREYIAFVKNRNFSCSGAGDDDQDLLLARPEMRPGTVLTVTTLLGDHFTSLAPTVRDCIERIRSDP